MAGLLDSDLVQFLATPRAYMARRNALKDAEAFQGLLGGLQQQGPAQPGGLLESRAPDQQFWLKAMQIPSYQDTASQQLGYTAVGQQAMARQQQQQEWAANNLTQEQQQQLAIAQAKAEREWYVDQAKLGMEGRRTDASVASSYASAGSSNASAALSQSKLIEQGLKNRNMQSPVLYNQLSPDSKVKANQDLGIMDRFAQGAMDAADWAKNRPPTGLGTAAGAAFAQQWQTTVKPAFAQAMAMGVIQGPEGEELAKIMGKPDSYILTDSDINVIDTAARMVMDQREQAYRNYGLQAPKQQLGQSPASKAVSANKGAKPQGGVKPWTPPAPSIWQPIDRR